MMSSALFPVPYGSLLVWGLPWLLGSSALWAQTQSVSTELALSSDLTDRGILVGPRRPIAQVQATLYDTSGWSVGVGVAAQMDAPNPSQILLRGGYEWLLSNDWQMQVGALYYSYPSDSALQIFDRTEVSASWNYRDVWAMSLTAHDFHLDADSQTRPTWTGEIALRWPLTPGFTLSGGLGHAQLEPRGSYCYGHLGVSWNLRPWRVEVNYLGVNPQAQTLFRDQATPHWALSVARRF